MQPTFVQMRVRGASGETIRRLINTAQIISVEERSDGCLVTTTMGTVLVDHEYDFIRDMVWISKLEEYE